MIFKTIRRIAGPLAILTFLATTGLAGAQTPVPSAKPSPSGPSPAATPSGQLIPGAASLEHPRGHEYFLVGDYTFLDQSRNEFNRFGTNARQSIAGRAGLEHPIGPVGVMIEGTYDHWQYFHEAGFVNTFNGFGFLPTSYIHQTDWDGRIGLGLKYPRIFVVASYARRQNNVGYPNLQGFGYGIEKLPDFNEKVFSFFGSYIWYPEFGDGTRLSYGFYRYQGGIEVHPFSGLPVPIFLEISYAGDYGYNRFHAPSSFQDNGFFAGFGLHF
jgi:hypothetical protein